MSRIFEGIGVTNFRFETEEIDVPHRTTSALENFDFDFRKSAHESAAVRGMLASLLDSCDMIELPTSVLAQAAGADGPFENKKLKAAAVKLDNKGIHSIRPTNCHQNTDNRSFRCCSEEAEVDKDDKEPHVEDEQRGELHEL